MLKQLYIKDYALIDELNIDLHRGFSVITGETGAGKSIILGALGLLLGQRADIKSIKSGAKKCTVEAHFDLSRYPMEDFFTENEIDYDLNDCILRREITATGKSRAFINDTPVTLTMMRLLGQQLILSTRICCFKKRISSCAPLISLLTIPRYYMIISHISSSINRYVSR